MKKIIIILLILLPTSLFGQLLPKKRGYVQHDSTYYSDGTTQTTAFNDDTVNSLIVDTVTTMINDSTQRWEDSLFQHRTDLMRKDALSDSLENQDTIYSTKIEANEFYGDTSTANTDTSGFAYNANNLDGLDSTDYFSRMGDSARQAASDSTIFLSDGVDSVYAKSGYTKFGMYATYGTYNYFGNNYISYSVDSLNYNAVNSHIYEINGSEIMRANSTGLGIGNTNPSYSIEIEQNNPTIFFTNTSSNKTAYIGRAGGAFFVYSKGNSPLYLQVENSSIKNVLASNRSWGNFVEQTYSSSYGLIDTDAEQAWQYSEPYIKQTTTANYIGLLMDVTEVSTGSGGASGYPNALIDLRISGTSKFKVKNNGYLGLGVNDPDELFHTDGGNWIISNDMSDADSTTVYGTDNNDDTKQWQRINFHDLHATYPNVLSFRQENDANIDWWVNGNRKIWLNDSGLHIIDTGYVMGFLGIGTHSPVSRLSVHSSYNQTYDDTLSIAANEADVANFLNENSSTTSSFLRFETRESSAAIARIGLTWETNAGGDLVFQLRQPSVSAYTIERMRITREGNVGINTDSPTQTLDVNGDIALNDTLILNSDTAVNADNKTTHTDTGSFPGVEIRGSDVMLTAASNGVLVINDSTLQEHIEEYSSTDTSFFDYSTNKITCKLDSIQSNIFYIPSDTNYYTIHASTFQPGNPAIDTISTTVSSIVASVDNINFYTSIELPNNCEVISVVVNGNAGATAEVYSFQRITIAGTNSVMAGDNIGTPDVTITNPIIDNENYSYCLWTSSLDSNDAIYNAQIIYIRKKL